MPISNADVTLEPQALARPRDNRHQPLLASAFVFRRQFSRRTSFAISFTASVALVLLWEMIVRLGWVHTTFFPAPTTILAAMWTMFVQGHLALDTGISILRVLVAFFLSVVMAVPLGIAMSSYRVIGLALEPAIDFIRYLPVPALVPLSIIWFGIGEETKIFLLWLGTFFQVVLFVVEDMNEHGWRPGFPDPQARRFPRYAAVAD
jgi:NitT/TauT family transport system permease protein